MKGCGATKRMQVFSHYAHGDPLPVYARYYDGEGRPTKLANAASIYVRCQREADHAGVHLARGVAPWPEGESLRPGDFE